MSEKELRGSAYPQTVDYTESVLSGSDIFYEKSETINELAGALMAAQKHITPPQKTKKVDYTHNGQRTKYSYAELSDCIKSATTTLCEAGLSVSQIILGDKLKTILMHKSGQYISSYYLLPDPLQTRPQAFGSHLTYARRYAYCAIIGMAAEEDDDGAYAQDAHNTRKPINDSQMNKAEKLKEAFIEGNKSLPPNGGNIGAQGVSSNSRIDEVMNKANENSPHTYRFPFGKLKGMLISEVPPEHLDKWYNAMVLKEDPTPSLKTALEMISRYHMES